MNKAFNKAKSGCFGLLYSLALLLTVLHFTGRPNPLNTLRPGLEPGESVLKLSIPSAYMLTGQFYTLGPDSKSQPCLEFTAWKNQISFKERQKTIAQINKKEFPRAVLEFKDKVLACDILSVTVQWRSFYPSNTTIEVKFDDSGTITEVLKDYTWNKL